MNHRTKPDNHDRPESEPASPTQWYDEPFLDHHLEEVLAALRAATGNRLTDAST
jgi:hypothetical protein